MARSHNKSRRRDTVAIANRRLPRYSYENYPRPYVTSNPKAFGFSSLMEFEDRRTWDPQGVQAPARSFSTPRHRLITIEQIPSRKSTPAIRRAETFRPETIAFATPSRVLICVRRKMRREVIHALGHAGRGGQKPPKFSEYSSISCRGA